MDAEHTCLASVEILRKDSEEEEARRAEAELDPNHYKPPEKEERKGSIKTKDGSNFLLKIAALLTCNLEIEVFEQMCIKGLIAISRL